MKIRVPVRLFLTAITAFAVVAAPMASGVASAQSTSGNSAQSAGLNISGPYVALGDSIAAGRGLPLASNASSEDRLCGRSSKAYSAIVGAQLHLATKNVACHDATALNLTAPQHIGTTSIQPQLDAAFAGGKPGLITLTIGANDVHWASFLQSCIIGFTRCDTPANTAAMNAYLVTLQTNLHNVLADISQRSNGVPPIVAVTGYYKVLSLQCVFNPIITASEINWINSETDALNQVLKNETLQFGPTGQFVPVNFSGHEICSTTPWVQDGSYPSGGTAPYHPNVAGQQAIAQSILSALSPTTTSSQ